jgi:hypothetical protein
MDHAQPSGTDAAAFVPQTRPVRAFLERLEALDMEQLREAIRVWRRELSDGWHEADHAVAVAMRDSQRHREQEAVLEALYDVFRRAPWFTNEHPGTRVASSDATAQYIATSAVLALLVCDRLAPQYLQTLYQPFASLIPLADLEPHAGRAGRDGRDGDAPEQPRAT